MDSTKIAVLILLFILISGCSKPDSSEIPEHLKELENLTVYPVDVQPAYEIQLVQQHIYSDTDEIIIGGITSTLVEDTGRVFILDGDQRKIHVFEPEGTYLKSFGGEGEGPGEFRLISFENFIHSNRLFIYDSQLLRITIFSLGSFTPNHILTLTPDRLKEIDNINGSFMDHYFVKSDSSLIIGFADGMRMDNAGEERFLRYYTMDWEGNIISEMILKLQIEEHLAKDSSWGITFPFFRTSIVSLSNAEHFYTAWSDEFLVKIYSMEGDYLRSFYYPYENASLNRQDVIERYDYGYPNPYLDLARSVQLPETWPALNSMQFDDQNRLWVSTIVDDQEVYQWWVLENSGDLLGRFTWPRNRRIEIIKNNNIYALEFDGLGGQKVVQYRIEMKK